MTLLLPGPLGKAALSKVTFEAVPERPNTVRHIGSLVFDMRNELGHAAYFDLRQIERFTELARNFIACLYEHARPIRITTDISLLPYFATIVEFLEYCRDLNLPSTFKMNEISTDFLLAYRSHIKIKFGEHKSVVPRRRFGNLTRLLAVGVVIGLTSKTLEIPRNIKHISDSDITQPYTAAELLDLEDACRTHIREITNRLEKGKQLLAQGRDPRGKPAMDPTTGRIMRLKDEDRPWNKLPNLLWYVVNKMDGRYLDRKELIKQKHSSFNNSVMGVWRGPYRKPDVYSLLYPLVTDLIPFAILLAKTTGRNEASLLTLQRDCLEEIAGRHVLWYRKARGRDKLYKKTISNEGQFSPVQLIKVLLSITEPLVRFAAPEYQNYLLLGLTVKAAATRNGRTDSVKPPEMSYFKFLMNQEGGWCEQRGILADNGDTLSISMRRLRVSYLTLRYRRTGQLAKVSRDAAHTIATTTVGYVNNDATKHIHEDAIEAGILRAREVSKITVIAEDSVSAAAEILDADSATVRRVLNGEQDVLFNSCRDYYNRPGGPPNTPCDQPWNCFSCPNTIITRHVLPRVMRLLEFIEEQRRELIETEWEEKFAGVHHTIKKDILPKFSAETIKEAMKLAQNEVFYIPLSFKW